MLTRQIFAVKTHLRLAQAYGMDKLGRAGRDFLIRLVSKHGLAGAARILRTLADELEGFARWTSVANKIGYDRIQGSEHRSASRVRRICDVQRLPA